MLIVSGTQHNDLQCEAGESKVHTDGFNQSRRSSFSPISDARRVFFNTSITSLADWLTGRVNKRYLIKWPSERPVRPVCVLQHTPSQWRPSGITKEPRPTLNLFMFVCFAQSVVFVSSLWQLISHTNGLMPKVDSGTCLLRARLFSELLSCTVTHFSSSFHNSGTLVSVTSISINTRKLMLSSFPPALCCRSHARVLSAHL